MSKEVATIDIGSSATEASKSMAESNTGYLVVLEKGKPKGIITDRDITMKVVALEKDPSKIKVSEFMSSPLITTDPDTHVDDTVELMIKYNIGRIPIVKNNILYGIFGADELVHHFDELEDKLSRDLIRACTI